MQSDEVGLKLLGQPWVRFPALFKLLCGLSDLVAPQRFGSSGPAVSQKSS